MAKSELSRIHIIRPSRTVDEQKRINRGEEFALIRAEAQIEVLKAELCLWRERCAYKNDMCPECGEDTLQCDRCDGSGFDHSSRSEIDCEDCGGSGKAAPIQFVKVGSEVVNAKYLRLIKDLPNVKISNCRKKNGALSFVFDGGDGLLMPIRVWKKSELNG